MAKLVAPSDYEVITPVTTLVASLTLNGMEQQEAELTVLNVLGLDSSLELSTYDPFFQGGASAGHYKEVSIKIANILMGSDGDLSTDGVNGFRGTLNTFSELIIDNSGQGLVLDLSDASVLLVNSECVNN